MKNLLIVSLMLLVFSSAAQAFITSPLQIGVRRTATNLSVFDGKSCDDFKLPNISEFYAEWKPIRYLGVEASWQEGLASVRTENYDLSFVTSPTITLKVHPLDLGPVDFFIGFGAQYIEVSGEYRTDRISCIFYPMSSSNIPTEHIQTKNSVSGENMSFVVQAGIGFPITNRLSIGIGVKCIQGFSMNLGEGKIRVGDGPWTDYPYNNGRISVIRLFQSNIGFNYSF
jgi:hypothetical protein